MNKEDFEVAKERTRPRRSAIKALKTSKSFEAPSSSENKEVKFMSFIKKIEESTVIAESPKTKSEKEQEIDEKSVKESVENKPHNSAETEALKLVEMQSMDEAKSSIMASEPIESEKEVKEGEQIEELQCLRDEIILCECCNHPITPSSTFVQTNKPAIFHLTATDEEIALYEARKLAQESESLVEDEKPDLKEILLRNYDPRFAARIGINDFVPVEVISESLDGTEKKLDFIPFETIDQSYPK